MSVLFVCTNISANRCAKLVSIGMQSGFLEDDTSKFYKYIVNEKVDNIDNAVFGVHCLLVV